MSVDLRYTKKAAKARRTARALKAMWDREAEQFPRTQPHHQESTPVKPMRAKVTIQSVKTTAYGETIEATPVVKDEKFGPNGESENNTFARYSPSGKFELTITNPALLGVYKPGQTFNVDFTPVEG